MRSKSLLFCFCAVFALVLGALVVDAEAGLFNRCRVACPNPAVQSPVIQPGEVSVLETAEQSRQRIFCPSPQQPNQPEYVQPPQFEFPDESVPEPVPSSPDVPVVASGEDEKHLSLVGIVAGLAGLVAGYFVTRDDKEAEELEAVPAGSGLGENVAHTDIV